MTHISLDGAEESVKRLVLSMAGNPAGTVVELDGRPVAWVGPPPPADAGGEWTDAKNDRRCDLITKKYRGGITAAEAAELAFLQEEVVRYRERVAPLPLEDVRQLHQELLREAARANGG